MLIDGKPESFLLLYLYVSVAIFGVAVNGMSLFDIKLVESIDSRLVATSNYNYAISSPKLLAKNWQTASVNGDVIDIVTTTGQRISKTKQELGDADRMFLEGLRDEISASNVGFTHSSMSGGLGGGTTMMSSMSQGGSLSSSSSSSSNFQSSGAGSGMSVSMKDDNNFSVAKSDLPFNWLRVFMNGNIVTVVLKDGRVEMSPLSALDASQLQVINKLKIEMKEFQATSAKQATQTMESSMNMVNNIFSNIMGNIPKPPSYDSAVGNMFGSNFPFGPNNSPFSAESGWPFGGGGGGGGAFAFAGGR